MDYTIERITLPVPKDVEEFLEQEIPKISKMFKDKFNFENRDDYILFKRGLVLVCKRDGEITGIFLETSTRQIMLNTYENILPNTSAYSLSMKI